MLEKKVMGTQLRPETANMVREIAHREKRSCSAQIELWIEQGIAADRAIQAARELDEVTQ